MVSQYRFPSRPMKKAPVANRIGINDLRKSLWQQRNLVSVNGDSIIEQHDFSYFSQAMIGS